MLGVWRDLECGTAPREAEAARRSIVVIQVLAGLEDARRRAVIAARRTDNK